MVRDLLRDFPMVPRTLRSIGVVSLLAWLLSGCARETNPPPSIGQQRARLERALDCGSLESMLRDDALAKMNAQIDALVASTKQVGGDGWSSPPAFGAPGGIGSTTPAKSDTASTSATDYSDTNTQVAGVDEADIVKNDGKYIYVLHGEQFLILNAWPATELTQSSSFAIEGQPTEMYVSGGRVVVYSVVDGAPIYQAAGVEPRPAYYDGIRYGLVDGTPTGALQPFPGYFYTPLTKMTVLTLNGTEPTLTRELYFEGSYVSSRRVEQHVRTVIAGGAHGPALSFTPPSPYPTTTEEWVAAYEALRTQNAAKIAAATYADWVPLTFTRTAAGVVASHGACEDFYVPTAGTTDYGMTTITALDLSSADAPKSTTVMGAVDTVYSTSATMYLASRSWGDPAVAVVGWAAAGGGAGGAGSADGGTAVTDAGVVGPGRDGGFATKPAAYPAQFEKEGGLTETLVTVNRTHLHEFTFTDLGVPVYVASGTVPGSIDDQFSIDEYEGRLRIATTEEKTTVSRETWQQSRTNDVFVLETTGDELRTVGSLTNLAPNERIYSSRFIGAMAYLVTFRQIDPLFAVDLSNPVSPTVLGALEIPGFSEYMHPIDATHLVTIGRDQGVAVQLFDVSNPAKPALVDKFVFTVSGYTEAAQSHKALTYFPSRNLLAFPFVGYAVCGPEACDMRSTLELFRVDASSIAHLGSIDHSGFFASDPTGYCGGYYGAQIRRGIFMDDFVYAISYGGVTANALTDLVTPVGSLPLPPPETAFSPCFAL